MGIFEKIAFVAIFLLVGIACQNIGGDCECTTIKIRDARGGTAGDCISVDSEREEPFCYVNYNSPCADKVESYRVEGLYASFQACRNRPIYKLGLSASPDQVD